MSISLEDVSFLLKIPVTGKVVEVENFARYTEESRSDAIKMVSNLLGVSARRRGGGEYRRGSRCANIG
ncbi:hypothetical protein Syun_001901 [Stephania yunnanensis]|uniref:Uncharacterized protein n=1 Tax=Stephania yunnanensis TaxID=152371 RepID=A0AAP0LET7_9MAGN